MGLLHYADCDLEFLRALNSRGGLTADELAALRLEPTGIVLSPKGVDGWLNDARRRGLIQSDPEVPEERRLTDEGRARLFDLEDKLRLVPRRLSDPVIAATADGLLLSIKGLIAVIPTAAAAWAIGLLNDPNPVAFILLGGLWVVVAFAYFLRLRHIGRAAAAPAKSQSQRFRIASAELSDLSHRAEALLAAEAGQDEETTPSPYRGP